VANKIKRVKLLKVIATNFFNHALKENGKLSFLPILEIPQEKDGRVLVLLSDLKSFQNQLLPYARFVRSKLQLDIAGLPKIIDSKLGEVIAAKKITVFSQGGNRLNTYV